MPTAPIVEMTGRSAKKNANKFRGVVANRTIDGTGRLVHIKLGVRISTESEEKRSNAML